MDTRLAKIELKLIDGDEKIEEFEEHLEELSAGMDELRDEVQGALNATIDKLAGKGETTRHVMAEELVAIREENRGLREELDKALLKMKEVVGALGDSRLPLIVRPSFALWMVSRTG